MLWLILSGVVVTCLWYKMRKDMNYWKDKGVPQSDPWLFFGDSWRALFRKLAFAEYVEWAYNMYPNSRYSGFYQFSIPTLLIRDPELIKQVAVKDFDHFTDHRAFIDAESDPLWAGNLLALKGQRWREMRATLSGTFTSSKMKNMFNLMEETAENFAQFFLNKKEDLIEIEMKDAFTRYANDVIATSAFGIQCNSLAEPDNEFYQMGKKVTSFNGIISNFKIIAFMFLPKISRFFKIGFFMKEVSMFFTSLINDNIKTREEKGIVRQDMINLLLEARKGVKHEEKEAIETGFATVKESTDIGKFRQVKYLTNLDITCQALIFFFAGFDTISTVMCFGSYELAINKEIQDKLRDEIKETYEKNNGKITYDALLKMKYLDMVLSEMLRKWNPGPALDRICTKSYVIEPVNPDEKPVSLVPGDVIFIPVYAIHRDPNYYPDPDKFDPERFSDENKSSITDYTYMPFGVGPRNCIGSRFALLEIKAIFFNLLLNFEIVPTKKSQIPLKLNRKSFQHTAEGGFWFALKRLKQ